MRVVVMGGTGLVGLHLLQALSAARISTVSLARRVDVGIPGIEWRVLDSMNITAADIPKRSTVAFCCLGTTMHKAGSEEAFRAVDQDLVLRFAKACKEAGVAAFHVVSAAGANPHSRIFYSRVKGEVEAELQRMGFRTLGIYRPSLILGKRKERRGAEKAAQRVMGVLSRILPPAVRGIPARTLAVAMVREASYARGGVRILRNGDLWRVVA